MKKRLIALMLVLCVVLPLMAACGDGNPTETEPVTEPVTEPQGTESATETEPETETEVPTETEAQTEKETKPITNANAAPEPLTTREAYTYEDDGTPIGTGIGVNAGRVVWAHASGAFHWNGTGYWMLESNFDAELVNDMVRESICQLAGEADIDDALYAIFREFNLRKTGVDRDYAPGEKIAIKGNFNADSPSNSASSMKVGGYFPAPVTLRALLTILVEYGVDPEDITVYDASRTIPTYVQEMCSDGILAGVHFEYNDSGYFSGTHDVTADLDRPIRWSYDIAADNLPKYNGYPTYNTSYLPTCVTEAAYMINLFNLRGHTLAGFTASAKNHFGTVLPGLQGTDGNVTFSKAFRENPPSYAGLHRYVASAEWNSSPAELWTFPQRPMGTWSPLVDLLSNANAGGKTLLYVCDALAATVNQGSNLTMNEQWLTFANGDSRRGWTNSILVSQDPIAIDSVCLDFVQAERDMAVFAGGDAAKAWNGTLVDGNTAENYLIEGALAFDPPSGTYYKDGEGNLITSLGVHEHWNNPQEKLYSRNLGADEGIELVQLDFDVKLCED